MKFRKVFVFLAALMILTPTFAFAAEPGASGSGPSGEQSPSSPLSSPDDSSPPDAAGTTSLTHPDGVSPGNAEDGLTSVDNSSEESAETLPADPENDEQADFRDPEEDPSKAQSPQNAVPSVNIADLSSFGNASHISADDAYLTSLFSGAAVTPIRSKHQTASPALTPGSV